MDQVIIPCGTIEEMLAFVTVEPRSVYTFIHKHLPALPDGTLAAAFDWTREDGERMASFRHQPSKTSWCVSRIIARRLLSRLTGHPWQDLPWVTGRFGKPELAGSPFRFNWSHTEGCLVFSLCIGMETGCDVEFVDRRTTNYLDIAKECFLPEEALWIGFEEGRQSWERFLSLFVQKEAWLKASGRGLDAPFSSVPARLANPNFIDGDSLLMEAGFPERFFISVRVLTNQTIVDAQVSGPVSFMVRSCTETP